MEQYKKLYLASNIEALNSIAESINNQQAALYKKPTTLMNVARKLYQKSQSNPYDEEMTYILLYRFLKIYNHILLINNDSYFISNLLGKEAHRARAQIADLENKLIKRYEENIKRKSKVDTTPVDKLMPIYSIKKGERKTVFNNVLFINCLELFHAISNKDIDLLVMDARSEQDFAASHIKDVKCVNIPENCIRSGLSAYRLGLTLPSNSIVWWDRRDSFDAIVLLDWNTCKTTFTASKLDKLRITLVEWDVGRNYKEKPVVLDNGYIEWLDMYPMLCTNSNVKYLKANAELDDLLSLDSIEYMINEKPRSIDQSELLEMSQHRQNLLDQARQAKKPSIIKEVTPTINRTTKPKVTILPTVFTDLEGKEAVVEYGLTGLINIRNTCYMNAIIQCLRHIPEIIEFYVNDYYIDQVNRTHPIISYEVADLIRACWSNIYSVIEPLEFYRKFTTLCPVFRQGFHEDCMEFFLQLYNYLHEDCALDVESKNFWTETQMAWYRQHGGKTSFFINLLYHQIKIRYSCKVCKTSSLKFDIENVFYLSVPESPFNLEQSIHTYLNTTEKVTCKKCNTPKDVEKKICTYPITLVIVLKRHMQDFIENNTVHYRKNENKCYFPLDDLQVGNCTYTLRAVALHFGNADSGHYTAACLNPVNTKWYEYDDTEVYEADMYDDTYKTRAYAFFYRLKENYASED